MTDTKSKLLRSNIWKFYLHQVFAGMFFYIPVNVLFLLSNGLNLTQVMILQSIFSVAVVILEIPTGYFADIYGRKRTLVLARISFLAAMVAYSLGHNFAQFLIAEIFLALGAALTSGTTSAFLFDTLVELKEEQNFKKIFGHAMFVGMIAAAVSSVLGGFVATIDLRYTLYASIPFFALLIPVALSFHEPARHKLIFKEGYTREIFRILKVSLIENEKLRWLMVYSGIVFAFNLSAAALYQPYFKLSGLDIVYFGIVFASFHIVAAITSKYAYKLEAKLGQKHSLVMLIFLVSGSYFLMSNFIFLFSFSFSFIHQFIRGFKNVVVADYVNKLTTSDMRATVLSVESFIGRLLIAAVIPFVGWMADIYSLTQALTVLAFTTLFLGIIILAGLRKYRLI